MMYIGELAKLTGASRKAIHHYEALGLIPQPPRKGRYRIYRATDVDLVAMIKCAQSLGFSLKEIAGVTSAAAQTGTLPAEMVLELIERKRQTLRQTIDRALAHDRQLVALQADLRRNAGLCSSPA